MQEILTAFQEHGLSPENLALDGRVHRFRVDAKDSKESGWYIGWQNHTRTGGEIFYVVVYGNYRLGESYKYQSNVKLSADDRRTVKEQIAKAQRIEDEYKKRINEETSKEVSEKWERLSSTGDSAYLRGKSVVECPDLGVRYEDGSIYVPMRDETGKLWSLQKIQWDGSKFFYPGGRVSGCFHVLGSLDSSRRILISEGLATGCSLRLASGLPVVVGFNSGNLSAVTAAIRGLYPEKELLVCGDEDQWTVRQDGSPYNPGREKAEEAAKLGLGKATFPTFKDLEGKPTDWNDLHVREGLQAVKDQICPVEIERHYVIALGFREKEYFFTSSHNRQILAITKFHETDFLGLAPLEYWESAYPGGGAIRVDWTSARSRLMDAARKRGVFQPRHVRGTGVWNDEGRVVVNMGDHLVVDGDRVELGSLRSRYFYTLGSSLAGLHVRPLSFAESETLVRACSEFRWLKSDYSFLMAGALVVSRICGALPVRPHVWITGGAQTGKTTLLERLIKPVIGESTLYVQGATTEAGIRQSLHADAIPVVFDEFETSGQKSGENVAACIELMRAAWSDSSAYIIKGSAGGNASAYQVRFSAIVSSIRTKLTNDADRSRFAIIELAPHGSDQDHWQGLDQLLCQIDGEYGERLFARSVKMIPVLLANFKTLKRALANKTSQRFGDQYGMLLAGYSILLQDAPISIELAEKLVEHVQLTEEREEAKVADQDDALTQMLTKKIRFERDGVTYERTISEMILTAAGDGRTNEALQRLGIKADLDTVSIAHSHTELETQVFRGTRWSHGWANSLARLPGAEKNKSTWLAGKNQKCVKIPRSALGLAP